jgi:preprotein translocase subunit SecF
MALLRFPEKTTLDFVGFRTFSIAFSMLVVVLTLGGYFFQGLKYGIDFQGGLMMEIRFPQTGNLQELRKTISQQVTSEVSIQELGTSHRDFLIRVEQDPQDLNGGPQDPQTPQAQSSQTFQASQILQSIKSALGETVEYRRVETIGPKVGKELIVGGLIAVFFALVAMLAYIWLRFEWQFSVCAIVALVHDCVAVVGLFVLTRLEFNETAIVAILITASYSINDTVVIFDRVRENLRKFRKMPLPELLNLSLNETLSRTLLTSGTTLVALISLYFLGGDVIASYSLPIIIGIGIGTYSSIFLAAPLLPFFKLQRAQASEDASATKP